MFKTYNILRYVLYTFNLNISDHLRDINTISNDQTLETCSAFVDYHNKMVEMLIPQLVVFGKDHVI